MPTLTYKISDQSRGDRGHGGVFASRVLIGRRLSHGVVLSDVNVSRLHAWIDPTSDATGWVLTDAGSTTGTFVNDQKIAKRLLNDGDTIRVGNTLVLFHDGDILPPDLQVIALTSPTGTVRAAGILFECHCGAPLWVGSELAGKRGMCRHCKKPVTVPALQVSTAPLPTIRTPVLKSLSAKRTTKCAVCHSQIQEDEESTQCPDCAMQFHIECWQENFGCSSYGCPQVDVLKPPEAVSALTPHDAAAESVAEAPADTSSTPWDLVLLAASVVGAFVGAMAFGSIALVVAIVSLIVLIRGKQRRPLFLVLAILISIVGVIAGLGASDFLYFNARHIPAKLIKR